MLVDARQRENRPNWFERAIARVAPQMALERAIARERLTFFGYDAANPGARRGGSGGLGKNSSSESPRMNKDRITMMWDARDLVRNMPVMNCAVTRTAQYVCSRLVYRPRSGDPEWDVMCQLWLDEWMEKYADITDRWDFRQLTELAFVGALRDGQTGGVPQVEFGMPRLQLVEGDRIGDPTKAGIDSQREDFMHGIHLDEWGRPKQYDVFRRSKLGQYVLDQEVAAHRFWHLFFPSSTDQYHGVTWLAPVLAGARDLYEHFRLEMGAAKWAASIAGVVKSIDSRNPTPGAGGVSALWDGETVNTDGQPKYDVKPNSLLRLQMNEDVEFAPDSPRPGNAFLNAIDAHLRDIAMGLNTPFGFFDMRAFNGVTVRIETMQCQRTFQRFQRVLEHKWLNPARELAIAAGIALGKIPAHPNWLRGRWQFGPHLTADVGYQTQADINMMLHGLKTGTEIAEEYGEDFEEMATRIAEEAEYLYAKAVEKGIPIELLAPGRFSNGTQLLSMINAAAEEEDAQPDIETIGDKGAKTLAEIQVQVAEGILPREEAVQTLIHVWNFDPKTAQAITPEFGSAMLQEADKQAGRGEDDDGSGAVNGHRNGNGRTKQKQKVKVRVNGN